MDGNKIKEWEEFFLNCCKDNKIKVHVKYSKEDGYSVVLKEVPDA